MLMYALSGKKACLLSKRRKMREHSNVTVAEIYSGMRPHEQRKTDDFISALAWYNTDLSLARQAGRLRFEYAVAGC
jgi:hypothetical protein